jgi:branched-chain amino acid transport system ATP-binding protein
MKRARDEAIEIIEFLGLRPKMDYPLSDVTLAEQRFVELAKALATKPEMLFLDEVMAGLTPEEIRRIIIKIKEVNQRGTTIVLVEHVMSAVMNLSEKLYVLNEGKLIAEGTPAEIARNGEVIKAYLGVEYHA